jgi:dipeptidyl-peptidase-4
MPLYLEAKSNLTLSDVVKGKYRPEYFGEVVPMPDGEHYAQMNADGTKITKYSYKTGKAVEDIFDVNKARECDFKRFDSFQFSPDGTKMLIATDTRAIYRRSTTAVHYLYPITPNLDGIITNNKLEKLSDGGPQQIPVFSPDGNMVAFVRDNDIYLVKMLYGNSESRVTDDGAKNKVLNGIPDWVYEEEFATNSSLEFSPDNSMIAYIRYDESDVAAYSFPLFAGQYPRHTDLTDYPGSYTYKYPKAGFANSKVEVRTFDIKSKVTRTMQVPIDADGYIPRIHFTDDPTKLVVMTLNRHQNRLDIFYADPRSTVAKMVVREESDTYIDDPMLDNVKFYADGFGLLSERDGYSHLYWYAPSGKLLKQVTKGKYVVKEFLGYDSQTGAFYVTSNEESPMRTAVYKIDKNGKKLKLSAQTGINNASFSPSMKYFINSYTNLNTPNVTTLNDANGKVVKTLVDNKELRAKIATDGLPQKEFFSFKNAEGTEINGWMMKPTDFSASQKYPVIMYQYSGPGSQNVLDQYGVTWETYMATQGFVMVCVDGRGTGGRGADYQKCTYMKLGVKEADDQVAAAQYLGTLPYVDKDRIGIWGWSFGGYTTLMSMSQGTPVFKAGVAVAAPTDWRYYDTIYTERFMRTPKENAEGYKASSAFERADKLSGKLLLIHGMADDNVHFQNCAEYSEHLVQIGKQFDMQVYTNRNHSIYGGNTRMHLYTRITEFFKNNL